MSRGLNGGIKRGIVTRLRKALVTPIWYRTGKNQKTPEKRKKERPKTPERPRALSCVTFLGLQNI